MKDTISAPAGDTAMSTGYIDSTSYGRASPSLIAFAKHHLKMVSAIVTVILFIFSTGAVIPCSTHVVDVAAGPVRSLQQYARAAQTAALEVFQVYPPVLTASGTSLELTDGSSTGSVDVSPSREQSCQETLVVHSFGLSYGKPYVGPYTPPPCSFNRVTWNLTVTSAGRQFDRLGTVSFGDIELFRTSTAEPTPNGISWTYLKDVTNFLALFKQPQTIIFDLGNLISDVYTGPFNVTLTAVFFTADDSIEPADLIFPISKHQGAAGQPSYFAVPDETASDALTLPRNIRKAVFTVAATGQAAEEFWWSNVLQSDIDAFPSYGTLYGYSPFREVQLLIDGMLAGVAWPFPVIFTGGVVPGLWRPIVGIDAFDLKEDEIDITPWLPLLCDGKPHIFTIRVSGLNNTRDGVVILSETIGSNWWVAGKVFVWLDEPSHITSGTGPVQNLLAPTFQVSSKVISDSTGANETLIYSVNAQRNLSLRSIINTSRGKRTVTWSQNLSYSNSGNYTDQGNIQTNTQQTNGQEHSSSGYARIYSFPLYAYSTAEMLNDNLTLTADVRRGKNVKTLGEPVFPTGLESFSNAENVRQSYGSFQGASLATTQNGQAFYTANQTAQTSYSYGTTVQDMTFSGLSSSPSLELFHRHVEAVNGTVVEDDETLINKPVGHYHGTSGSESGTVLSGFPGRGGFGNRFRSYVMG